VGLRWSSVQREHVVQACESLLLGNHRPTAKGLCVLYKDRHLPAKQVLRVAYCLANSLPVDTNLKFASGEGTLGRLRSLGFQAERIS
jgi:hypothetical protein